MTSISRRGFMLVLSSPSGAGKTSIATKILEVDKNVNVSISVTTRLMRPGEREGEDYFFVTKEQFQSMLHNNELLEHADVFGHSYGTPKHYVFDTLTGGKDIIFDIDWQGTQQLAQLARVDLVSVFILPPSLGELEKRLNTRAQDSADVILNRMKEASNEMSHWAEYDYVIVNEDLEQSVAQVHAIITAERLKRNRQRGLLDFVNKLRGVN
ncbi:guanylate kinase [Candidatus Paracaedibacter symbiosus]|uniref:guanylate kinase n=1 Tax=Candidatus Paracaedibacter symbiosus TaxID=244582 RepID=UPI000509A67F|nr:guanylate kinase [Candidatus Paracaedibacter symbiosus]